MAEEQKAVVPPPDEKKVEAFESNIARLSTVLNYKDKKTDIEGKVDRQIAVKALCKGLEDKK